MMRRPRGLPPVRVDLINSIEGLDALRDKWRRLHALDAHANIFTSWPWLRAWADVSPYPWAILVAREDHTGEVAGLLPISPRGLGSAIRLDQVREIHFMGDEAADYRGFICDPARQDQAVDAFADALAADRAWDRLVLKDALDPRIDRFLDRLRIDDPALVVSMHRGNACPLLELPPTWDDYLGDRLTPPSRKSLKKRLRLAEEAGCTLTTTAGNGDMQQHLDALLHMAEVRGKNPPEHLQACRALFESCLAEGAAEIAVLWVGDDPAAAQGSLIDRRAHSLGHYLAAFDGRFAPLSPGRVLDALCIRQAIERGRAAVDFLRGDEAYKHQLGARARWTQHAWVRRRGWATRVRTTVSGIRARLVRS